MTAARRILPWVIRLGLGGLFLAAGMLKLRDPSRFALEIANYQLLPGLAPHLAIVLPGIELAAALAVLFAPVSWRRAGAIALAAMLAAFTVAVSTVLARGINIECGCFGGGEGPVTGWTVLRNAALLAAAGTLLWLERPGQHPGPQPGPHPGVARAPSPPAGSSG